MDPLRLDPPEPPSLIVRLDAAAPHATSGIVALIAQVLEDNGAQVTFGDPRGEESRLSRVTNHGLKGLHVHFDRMTWVRQEEARRWKVSQPTTSKTQP